MKFNNEEEFRRWIVGELPTHLGQEWTVIHGKNVSDVVLCRNDENRPLILFVEVKYHKVAHGRIGFGNATGKGYQTEILLRQPIYLEKYLRWIIADQDSEQCLFFTNDDVRSNCAGRIEEGKQNNFRNRLFDKNKVGCFDIIKTPLRIAEWANEAEAGQ